MKKGFTIVELLAAIVILAVIIGLAVPAVNNVSVSVKRNTYESIVKNIESAGSKYAFDTGDSAVFVDTLIKDGYLRADDENGKIVNPLDDTELNCYIVEMERINDYYKAKLTDNEQRKNGVCNDDKIKEKNAEVYITVTNDGRTVSDYSKWLKGSVSLKADSRNFNLNCTANDCHWVSNRGDDARGISYVIPNTNVVVNSLFNFQVTIGSGDNLKRYQASTSVKIDNEKPIVDIETTKNTLTNPYIETRTKTIKINASDGTGSGIAKYYFGTASNCNSVTTWYDNNNYTINANGRYIACVKDNVGNISETQYIDIGTIYVPNYIDFGGFGDRFAKYKDDAYRDNIVNVYFVDYIDLNGAVNSWDLSDTRKGTPSGNIMAWLKANGSKYDLYIGSNKIIKTEGISYAFCKMTGLVNVYFNDRLDVSEADYLEYVFSECSSLSNIVGLKNWDVSNVKSVYALFEGAAITSVEDLRNWNVSKFYNIDHLFCGTKHISDYSPIAGWNVSNVKYADFLFYNNEQLTNVNFLSNWKMPKLESLDETFTHCHNLSDISGIANWDMSKIKSLYYTFYECDSLTVADFSKWYTPQLGEVSAMFYGCENLKTVYFNNAVFDNIRRGYNDYYIVWMFNGVPSDITIYVKESQKAFIEERLRADGKVGNIITV